MDDLNDTESFLADYDPRAYDPVAVTVDVVALTLRDAQLQVLLVRRGEQPYRGSWALPGGFVRPRTGPGGEKTEEDLAQTAARELAEEAGPQLRPTHLEQLGSYGTPGRDPRMRVISVAYLAFAPEMPEATAGTDAADAQWTPIASLTVPNRPPRPSAVPDRPSGPSAVPDRLSGLGAVPDGPPGAVPDRPSGPGAVPDRPSGPGAVPDRPSGPGAVPARPSGLGAVPDRPSGPGAVPDRPSGAGAVAPSDEPIGSVGHSADGGIAQGATAPLRLAFDHAKILADGVERARAKLEYTPLATAFVREPFTISELREVYETVWGEKLHAGNFHRKVLSVPGFVESTGDQTETGGHRGGPRAKLYRRGDATLLHPALLRPASEEAARP